MNKNKASQGESTLVLKFGGAAVATPDHFGKIAQIIASRKEQYTRLIVVVSAMGDTTDELISLARKVHPNPPRREHDMLVTVGERVSISLLAMALDRIGLDGVSFTGSQSGIMTTADHTHARIVDVRAHRVNKALEQQKIAIVAGFQGVSLEGEITTLGRGGSDTTAVALAMALGAQKVEFYKDVEGVFTADPHKHPEAQWIPFLSYEEALELLGRGNGVLHTRCVRLAWQGGMPLEVRSFLWPKGGRATKIGGKKRGEEEMWEEHEVQCIAVK